MGSRQNQLLFGVIILLVGLYALFRPTFSFSVSALMFTISGLSFLLLYRTKRKSWSLVLGGYLTYIGIMKFVQPYVRLNEAFNIIGPLFFIVPSLLFLVLYYDKNKRGLLLPAMLMLCFGVFLFMKDLAIFRSHSGLLFLFCMGDAFVLKYLLSQGASRRSTLIFGCFLIAFGLIFFGGLSILKTIFGHGLQGLSILLILGSGAIIIHALRRR